MALVKKRLLVKRRAGDDCAGEAPGIRESHTHARGTGIAHTFNVLERWHRTASQDAFELRRSWPAAGFHWSASILAQQRRRDYCTELMHGAHNRRTEITGELSA